MARFSYLEDGVRHVVEISDADAQAFMDAARAGESVALTHWSEPSAVAMDGATPVEHHSGSVDAS